MKDDDPYSDQNGVLQNTLGLSDGDSLRLAEQKLSLTRAYELASGSTVLDGSGDLEHLKAVHQHLFQDVYPWAGETRDVRGFTGYKPEELLGNASVDYPAHDSPDPTDNLGARLDYAFTELAKTDRLRGLDNQPELFVSRLAHHVSEIWECHAFREGNTRTISLFAMELARLAGQPFERTLINQDASIRDSLVLAAARSESRPLEAIFHDSLALPDSELGSRSVGRVLSPSTQLAVDIDRARSTFTASTTAILEKMVAHENEAVLARERGADDYAHAVESHLGTKPNAELSEPSREQVTWERDHQTLELKAAIARQNAIGAMVRFDANAGVRQARASADAEFGNGPEAALLKRDRMTNKAIELHGNLVKLAEERSNANESRETTSLDRRINDIATTLTQSPFYRMALDPQARRFVQQEKQRSGRSVELQRTNENKKDLGRSR